MVVIPRFQSFPKSTSTDMPHGNCLVLSVFSLYSPTYFIFSEYIYWVVISFTNFLPCICYLSMDLILGLNSDLSTINSDDQKWFFCQHDEYKNAICVNRATNFGYWKDTCMDCHIESMRWGLICIKKTLVYHTGPKGLHTNWVMHEYHASGPRQVQFQFFSFNI